MQSIRSFLLRVESFWLLPQKLVLFGVVFCALVLTQDGWARLGPQYQMALGNPDGASTNEASRTKFLINKRAQYAISYNDDTHQANWVSWSYSLADDGNQARTDYWQTEELLPAGYLKIGTAGFGTGWDRGHMCPSADRTLDLTNNQVTFRMSNIIPQASSNNQGLWADFEDYCRTLSANNNEILIISGPAEFTGTRLGNQMAIPGSVWKIAVVVPGATSTTAANQRINTSCRVIAILTPNVNTGLGTWQSYITSVERIEEVTGMNFFTAVDPSVAIYLKNVIDSGSGPNSPTVLTSFSPTLGAPSDTVTISGYNFNASSIVQFNGVQAASVTYVSPSLLTAVVPVGATTGPITVTGSGGTDTSYADFTVTTSGSTPLITVVPATISGFAATEGAVGATKIYSVIGSLLSGDIVVSAPADFEISKDGTSFATSLSLARATDGSLSTQIYARIKSNTQLGIVSGNITHSSSGAAPRIVAVSGEVTPKIVLSATSLSGFAAISGATSSSKIYTVSGGNLDGTLTITAPTNYQVSLNNSNFTATQTLVPVERSIPTTTVYVRLAATAPLGSVTGSITHAANGADVKNLALMGNVATANNTPVRIAAWDFTGESNVPTSVAEVFDPGLDSDSTLTRGSGAKESAGNNSFRTVGFQNNGISITNTDYFQFTLSCLPGASLSLNSITARFAGTSTYFASPGAANQFAYSTNGTDFVLIGTPTVITNTANPVTFSLAGQSALQNLSAGVNVTFRFYASGQTTTGGWGFNSPSVGDYGLDINGTISNDVIPVPAITISGPTTATAFESFSYQIQANNSPTSYAANGLPVGLSVNSETGVISGTPTTPGTYNVVLTASNASGDGTASLLIDVQANPNRPLITSPLIAYGQASAAFSYQIIATNSPTSYIATNLPSGLAINTLTGLISGVPTAGGMTSTTISAINDFGSDTQVLQITVRSPSLALDPATLNSFSSVAGSFSQPQTYTISGVDLTESILARAPQFFEISTNNVSFTGEITLNPGVNGTLSQTLWVRLADSAPPGQVSGSIAHSGSGAIPKYLDLAGVVTSPNPTLTLSTASLTGFSAKAGSASVSQTYELSGFSLTSPVVLTPPSGFEIGMSENAFTNTLSLIPSGGQLAATNIYVRLRSDASAGTYSGNIVHASAGAVSTNVAVSGTITAGPTILSASGGSAYAGTNTFSYTIRTDGAQAVISYSATGLPSGMSINTTNGLISGTPATAGTYNVTLKATSTNGTSSKPYTLRVITLGEQSSTPSVVINKYNASTTDRIELLVTGDNEAGPPVDLRGMIIKDFNSTMGSDAGGKYVFNAHPVWANVKAGTLIVLSAGNTTAEDLDASDFVLRINLGNSALFTQESGGFFLETTDMVMIKPAGMQVDGVAGGMHVLAAGNTGTQFNSFTGRKIRSSNQLSPSRGYVCMVPNSNRLLTDYYTGSASVSNSVSFGSGNNTNNTAFINTLRALDQDPPILTLQGPNPDTVNRGTVFSDAGASAFDAGDNQSKSVATTGSVNTSVLGSYTLTYSSADSKGNLSFAVRTVNVVDGLAVWGDTYGLNGTNAASNADPDGDGWSNAQEYAFGLNPTNAGGSLANLTQTTNQVKLAFLQKDVGGITYAVKAATSLTGGFTNSITPQLSADTNGVPAGYKKYEATLSTTNGRGFLKVEATIPP